MSVRSTVVKRQLADRPPSRGGVVDARSPIGRRRRELVRIYTAALGGPTALTDGQLIDIRKAAELVALAEQMRARAMAIGTGGAAELSAMVRLESAATRAVRSLGVKAVANTSKTPSLAEYAARKAAEKANSKPGGDPA
jgi:hypothetical protein